APYGLLQATRSSSGQRGRRWSRQPSSDPWRCFSWERNSDATALVLRTANTAPVWRGGTHCFSTQSGGKTGYILPPRCTSTRLSRASAHVLAGCARPAAPPMGLLFRRGNLLHSLEQKEYWESLAFTSYRRRIDQVTL